MLAALGLVTLAAVALLLDRYLAVFCQPGLDSFSDGVAANLAFGVGVALASFVALLAFWISSPMTARHFFLIEGRDNPLAAGFGWPPSDAGPRFSIAAYFAAYGPLYAMAAYYLGICLFLGGRDPGAWGLVAAFGVGLLAPLIFVIFRAREDRSGPIYFKAVMTTLQLGWFGMLWFVYLLLLIGDPSSALAGGATFDGVMKVLLATAAVLGLHITLTAFGTTMKNAGILIFACLVLTLTIAPGDRIIVYNALRASGVGGGAPHLYYDDKNKQLQLACIILSTGDSRIVLRAESPDQCDSAKMRKTFDKLLAAKTVRERLPELKSLRIVPKSAFLDL